MMNKQFAELQVYQLGGGIAFGLPGTTTPFLALPSGQATIKPWGTSGFLFENILTGDVIAFVAEYDDVLDSADTPYGVDQSAVFTALAAFFFDVAGPGGSQDLADVLDIDNASGPNDINFDSGYGLYFSNNSRLREGSIDAGLGGQKGIAQICAVGYELKWEGGRLYVMDGSGSSIRYSLYNFTTTPTVNDDDSKGYLVGSLWSLDDGTVYVCSDVTSGSAVWVLQQNAVPTLSQVLGSGNSADGAIEDLDYLDFDTAAGHTVAAGELSWNDTEGTLNLGLKGGNTISNVGQHIHARVVNKVTPNQTLTKAGYKAVRISGAQGQRLAVELAQGNNDANSADTIGLVCETIATNQEGFIVCVGQIVDINTTGSLQGETWADGDVLYLSPTTAGAITKVKPTGAGHIVVIGYVEYAHAVHGKIYVKVMNGWELDELHDVSINAGTLANNDVLIYESATSLWKNKRLPVEIQLAASDETTALTTGTAKMTFRMPHAMTLTAVRASLTTAQASGSIFTVDINQGGSSVLGTKLTIDNTEKTSTTAATAATITTSALTDDSEITIDIDQIGNGTATGLKITLIGTR
jgi:hypothetical protein